MIPRDRIDTLVFRYRAERRAGRRDLCRADACLGAKQAAAAASWEVKAARHFRRAERLADELASLGVLASRIEVSS